MLWYTSGIAYMSEIAEQVMDVAWQKLSFHVKFVIDMVCNKFAVLLLFIFYTVFIYCLFNICVTLCLLVCGFILLSFSSTACMVTDRLRDTLIHEMCHAATWLIDGNRRDQHGPCWQSW